MTVKYDEIGRLEIRVKAAEQHALKLEQDLLASEARVRELETENRQLIRAIRRAAPTVSAIHFGHVPPASPDEIQAAYEALIECLRITSS